MLIRDHTFIDFGSVVHPTCILGTTRLLGTPEYINLAWHHLEQGQALKTEIASLGLKLVWSVPWQNFFQFQICFQMTGKKAFF